ncbi:MAG: PspC domain-containing protein [Chlorobiales bacterium]|jgi:phage shock protein C|nr:PspC domain-containing protein [Chlorobiales bacterium]
MKKLYRSNTDKMISGIFGGLSKYLDIDATFLRVIGVVLALITGVVPLIIAYLVVWYIVPPEPQS